MTLEDLVRPAVKQEIMDTKLRVFKIWAFWLQSIWIFTSIRNIWRKDKDGDLSIPVYMQIIYWVMIVTSVTLLFLIFYWFKETPKKIACMKVLMALDQIRSYMAMYLKLDIQS